MNRLMTMFIMILVGLIVGGIAGLLAHAAYHSVPSAVLTGGGAFAGAVALMLGLAHYADQR